MFFAEARFLKLVLIRFEVVLNVSDLSDGQLPLVFDKVSLVLFTIKLVLLFIEENSQNRLGIVIFVHNTNLSFFKH